MKNYIKPEIEITFLNTENILMASGGLNLTANTQFTVKTSSGYNKLNF